MEEKKFDFNTLVGFSLIGAILLYVMYQNQPTPDQLALQQNTEAAEVEIQTTNDAGLIRPSISIDKADNEGNFKYNLETSAEKENYLVLENNLLGLKIKNVGGILSEVKLKPFVNHDSVPVCLIKDQSSQLNLKFSTTDKRTLNSLDLYFEPSLSKVGSTQILSLKARVSETQYLEYIYTLAADDYMLGFSIQSKGLSEFFDNRQSPEITWDFKAIRQDQSIAFENRYTRLNFKYETDKLNKLSQSGDDDEILKDISWISYRQHFFSSILVPDTNIKTAEVRSYDLVEDVTVDTVFTKKYSTKFPLSYTDGEIRKDLNFYFGPTYAATLKKYDKNLEASIPFGWGIFGWINKSIFSPLYAWLSSFLSYGIAIIVMTIMVKILLSFVQYKQFLSQAKMKILKPELDALREKYKGNKMKAQKETMALQNKAGASPLSGCLPGLLQIPVFYSLFMFFPIAFELRQKPFLWVKDLSSYDTIVDLPFNIPFYGDHISLFPILASIAIFFYMRMTTGQNMAVQPKQEGMPDMAKMMKYMIYFSPLLMLVFFNNYASGLSLYYFVSNLISIAIMLVIKNFIIDEAKVLAKIQVSKAKPKKQNRFQRKMSEIMEQAEKQKAMQERQRK